MAPSIELFVKSLPALLFSIPINMVYGRVARAIFGSFGDLFQDSLRTAAGSTEGVAGHELYAVSAWIPWGDVWPLVTYVPSLASAYAVIAWIGMKRG